MSRILPTPLRIYTSVWNNKYLDLLEKTLIKSFLWPENNLAIQNEETTWCIYTKESDIKRVTELSTLLPVDKVEIHTIDKAIEKQGKNINYGEVLLDGFLKEIKKCIESNSKLLIAPPDSLFGDGTLKNIFKTGYQDGVCISFAHPRVTPSILGHIKTHLTNPQLVSLAMNHLHVTWKEARLGGEFINSYVGGVQWEELSTGLYRVQHRLPTPYLLHFNQSDYDFFNRENMVFGAIDHLWSIKLLQEERIRSLGSSDAGFVCEVTSPCENIPPKYPVIKSEPDRFWRNAYQNQVYRQFMFIFRGE